MKIRDVSDAKSGSKLKGQDGILGLGARAQLTTLGA